MNKKQEQLEQIRRDYAKIALNNTNGSCCCSPGCCGGSDASDVNETAKTLGYSADDLSDTPFHANIGLGCGNPVAIAGLKEGGDGP